MGAFSTAEIEQQLASYTCLDVPKNRHLPQGDNQTSGRCRCGAWYTEAIHILNPAPCRHKKCAATAVAAWLDEQPIIEELRACQRVLTVARHWPTGSFGQELWDQRLEKIKQLIGPDPLGIVQPEGEA